MIITLEAVEGRDPEGDLDFDLAPDDFDPRLRGLSSDPNPWPDKLGVGSSRMGLSSGPTSSGSIHSSSPIGCW